MKSFVRRIAAFLAAFFAGDEVGLWLLERWRRRDRPPERHRDDTPPVPPPPFSVYCVQCGAAYVPGTMGCDYCGHTRMLDEPPDPSDLGEMTPAYIFMDTRECWEIENLLLGDGIPTNRQEREGGLNSVEPRRREISHSITLLIPERCRARADALLAAYGCDPEKYRYRSN